MGAGPAGLATAIAASAAGLDYQVLEKGTLVQSICDFPRNQIFFTTPELLEIGGLPFVTPYDRPTRLEALRYYRRVVERPGCALGVRLLQRDSYEAVGTLCHSLLRNRRAQDIAQQSLATLGVEPARAGRGMQGEPIE